MAAPPRPSPGLVRRVPRLFFFGVHVGGTAALAGLLARLVDRPGPLTAAGALLFFAIASQASAFLLFAWDKRLAIKDRFRVPEATLIAAAWLFGSVGAALAMLLFRHKTSRPVFWFAVGTALTVHALMALSRLG